MINALISMAAGINRIDNHKYALLRKVRLE